MLQLKPEYFKSSLISVSDFIVESCITTFCIEADPHSPLFLYDSNFTHEMIQHQNPLHSEMEVISVLFDFVDVLRTEVTTVYPFAAVRKLYAISFFVTQFIKQGNMSFLHEMRNTIEIAFKVFMEMKEVQQLTVAAVSFALSMLSARCRDYAIISIEDDDFCSIVKTAINISQKVPDALSAHTKPIFHLFFLSAFYSFRPDIISNEKIDQILIDLTNAVKFGVNYEPPVSFNFLSLCDKLISFLNNESISKNAKLCAYSFLADLSIAMEYLAEFLFEKENLDQFTKFLIKMTKSEDSNHQSVPVFKRFSNIKKKELPFNEIIKEKTFDSQVIINQNSLVSSFDELFNIKDQFLNENFFNKLFESTFTLCNSYSSKRFYAHSRYILSILKCEEASDSLIIFLMIWFKKVILMDPDEAFHAFGDFKIIQHFLTLGTLNSSQISEYAKNLNDTLVFMVKNCQRFDFLQDIFKKFEEDALSLSVDGVLINCISQCAVADHQKIAAIMKFINFDQRLAYILISMRSFHASDENDKEVIEAICRSRTNLFCFINQMFSLESTKSFLIRSTVFAETLCQLLFEPCLEDYVFELIGKAIASLKAADPQLITILQFIQKQLLRVTDANMESLCHRILNNLAKFFSTNPSECAMAFLHTEFFKTLDDFVFCTKLNEDLFCVFRILQDCSSLQDQVKDYLLDLNPFKSLAPLIESQINNEDIRNRLWSIVCGIECTFLDQVRIIKNSAPLSLLFRAMKSTKEQLLFFLKFIHRCCEKNMNTTFEVNGGDFPTLLIDLIHDYRRESQADELFDEIIDFLAFLSRNSMKSKDLLSMFQSLTLLPDKTRPFYTIDVLNCLKMIFNNPTQDPPSFIRSDGVRPIITIPETPLKSAFADFSIIFEANFKKIKVKSIGELLSLKIHPDLSITLWFMNNNFNLTLQKGSNVFEKTIPCKIDIDIWLQFALVVKRPVLSLYIDGVNRFETKIPLFEFKNSIKSGNVCKNIFCSLSTFYFFAFAFDQRSIKLFTRIPKISASSFNPSETDEFPHQYRQLLTDEIASNAVYIYNAAATYQNILPNLAQCYPCYPGSYIGKSYTYSPQPKYILHCVGGIPTIYPLFSQLDQPFNPSLSSTLISLITSLLNNCAVNQEEFYQTNGFQVISYLMACSKLENISTEFIEKLIELFNLIDYRPLMLQMFQFLFLDIQLWVYLPIEKQLYVYRTVINAFKDLPMDAKVYIVNEIRFSDLLMMMRVCLWSTKGNMDTNLLDKPKIDIVTKEVEANRPPDLKPIRNIFWELADIFASIKLTKRDAETLCFYSFEARDIDLCIETLKCLVKFIRKRNPVLMEVLQSTFNFKEFFPLFMTPNEDLRTQCLHIFMEFNQKDLKHLIDPYSPSEWVYLIIQYFNAKGMSIEFVDLVYAYMFGDISPGGDIQMRISQREKSVPSPSEMPKFAHVSLLALALFLVSDMPDEMCMKYISLVDKAIKLDHQNKDLTKEKDWDHPFLYVIVCRMKGETQDETVKTLVNLLVLMYAESVVKRASERSLQRTQTFLNLFSMSKNLDMDLNYIFRIILTNIIESLLLKGRVAKDKDVSIFITIIFEYIFLIPESDRYYSVTLSENDPPQKRAQYQRLHRVRATSDKTSFVYTYGIRTNVNGKWIDATLAEYLCQLCTMFPSILEEEEGLFMYSFTIGIGISNLAYYSTFSKYIRSLTSQIPPHEKISEHHTRVLLNYLSGLVKIHIQTRDFDHESHMYLVEDTKAYSAAISEMFKNPVQWGDTNIHDNFDEIFRQDSHHLAFSIIEKYSSECESYLLQQAASHGRHVTKKFADFVETRKSFDMSTSTQQIMQRNRQVTAQLKKFALDIKHSKSKGLKKYIGIWRILSSERGPWRPPELVLEHYWKLDKSLQSVLKRGLMTENFSYNDHKDASMMRDSCDPDDAPEEYQNHLKKLRITDFVGDRSVMTLISDTDEMDQAEQKRMKRNDVILSLEAKLVSMKKVISGTFILTNDLMIFDSTDKYLEIELVLITSVYLRRYLLIDSSIEIFTSQHSSYFFDFIIGQRIQVIKELSKVTLKNLKFMQTTNDAINQLITYAQRKWLKGKMSNFDYLMALNSYSGRTYNDLAQYPVFPWILADYSSDNLDLTNPKSYRDLTVPIGAYTKDRLNSMRERMEASEEVESRYLYGSFYSSAAVVIGFLIRSEPFASLHIELQSGRFDIPERLFQSIPRTWNSVQTLQMDFRELIPEFFFLPDFLVNSNHFDLGPKINDVELPRWAKSPRDFIDKNRAALESPIVTMNLPRWIDMIFGVTSRGEPAVKINNIFNPLFFDDNIMEDIESSEDQRIFRTEYAACFGQAPHQLFKSEHPDRIILTRVMKPNDMRGLFDTASRPVLSLEVVQENENELINGVNSNNSGSSFGITAVNLGFTLSRYNYVDNKTQLVKSVQLPSLDVKSNLENEVWKMNSLVKTCDDIILSSSLWDNSFTLTHIDEGVKHTRRINIKKVSAIAISKHRYATASHDNTVMVWKRIMDRPQIPIAILSKHKSSVNSVDINESSNIVVSSARDGTVVTASLMTGKFIKLITISDGDPIFVKVSDSGSICVCIVKADKSLVKFYDINLNEINEHLFESRISCWSMFEWYDGTEYLAVAMRNHSVSIMKLPNFDNYWHIEGIDFEVTAMEANVANAILLIGTIYGKVLGVKLEEYVEEPTFNDSNENGNGGNNGNVKEKKFEIKDFLK